MDVIGRFNVIDEHDGLELLLLSRIYEPLLVEGNTNSGFSVGLSSIPSYKLSEPPEIMLPTSSSFRQVLGFIWVEAFF